MAKSYDWYFFPVVNPDGYEHTFNFVSFVNRSVLLRKQFNNSRLVCGEKHENLTDPTASGPMRIEIGDITG